MNGGRPNDAIPNEESTTMKDMPNEGSMTLNSLKNGRMNEGRRSPVLKQEPMDVDKYESPVIAIPTQVRPDIQGQVTLQPIPAVPQGPEPKGKKQKKKQAAQQDAAAAIPESVARQPSVQNFPPETVAIAAESSTIADNTEVVEGPAVINLGVRSSLLFSVKNNTSKNIAANQGGKNR